MAQIYFRNGQNLNQRDLLNRLERCHELFLTQDMPLWCQTIDQFSSTLNLNPAQSRQVRGFIRRRQPALYERINFMHTIRDMGAPNHPDVNPADRHFTPAAQAILRQAYSGRANRTEAELKDLLSHFPALLRPSPHKPKSLNCKERAEERIVRQMMVWWNCMHAATNSQLPRLNPPYFPDERHFMYDLIRHIPVYGINMAQFTANMWIYQQDKADNDMQYFRNANINPADIYNHAKLELDHNLNQSIKTKQDKLQWIIDVLITETRDAWEYMNIHGRNTSNDEEELANFIDKATEGLEYINHYLYYQATLQRELIRKLCDIFRLKRSYSNPLHQVQHQELILEFCKLFGLLIDRHEAHKRQHAFVIETIQWFMTTVNSQEDRKLHLSAIPAFVAGEIPFPPVNADMPLLPPSIQNPLTDNM